MSYKLHVHPHLDYGDVIYHNQRMDMMNLVEKVQYKAALVVSGGWLGTCQNKIYNELGWESLSDRRWYGRLCLFYKIPNHDTPQYLHDRLPAPREVTDRMRSSREFNPPAARTSRFTNSFYPYCISEWEKLSDDVKSLPSLDQFKSKYYIYAQQKDLYMESTTLMV